MSLARSSIPVTCFALSSLLAAHGGRISTPKQDTVWKEYVNTDAAYCISYPSHWYKEDAFDGSGIYVKTGVKKHSRATGEIDIGIFPNVPTGQPHAENISLDQDFQVHVEGLKKFERAERVQVLDQHPMEIAGSLALFTKDKYYDPIDRSTWVEEIVFIRRTSDLYRLELECRADQVARFEPVFSRFISTFRFDCGAYSPRSTSSGR